MCGLPFARPLSSFVRDTAPAHTDRLRPCPLVLHIGLAPLPRRCFGTQRPCRIDWSVPVCGWLCSK
nr:MAG TPA: hypothetical protein [Caudoviricetes sp.]